MVLHARAANGSAGRRLDSHRLASKRLVGHARKPIDRVLQRAGYGVVVLRGDDDHTVGGPDRIGQNHDR
jgi:hypothetical protein